MATAPDLFTAARYDGNPLSALTAFLREEAANREALAVDRLRFVGYVLDLGYERARIITADPYKQAVGGIPRSSFLILAPQDLGELPPHFSVLRVSDVAPTPLTEQVQQTYFELHKKSMPELDRWTLSELQWGALNCDVLGMMHPDPDDRSQILFSGDLPNVLSPHHYRVYAPPDYLLETIVNGLVPIAPDEWWRIGSLRPTESRLSELLGNRRERGDAIEVRVATGDFVGTRTAMFGKTRLGKSNVVKLIAQGILTRPPRGTKVGQVIFDINGEYANDNEWDGSGHPNSLATAYRESCQVYALTPRDGTPSKPLRLNFYASPPAGLAVLREMLETDRKTSTYIEAFTSAELPEPDVVAKLDFTKKLRPARKVLMYWAILRRAGYGYDEAQLRSTGVGKGGDLGTLSPGYGTKLRESAYDLDNSPPPERIDTLDQLVEEFRVITKYASQDWDRHKSSGSREPVFDNEDRRFLEFLHPSPGRSGPNVLSKYREFHSASATSFRDEILDLLDNGKTVILDVGNANDRVRKYFSDSVSKAVFHHQEEAFSANKLKGHYVQLYFEEAHNLFPHGKNDTTDIYSRLAKEGAKFHIGMVYSTQSPSTVSGELLAQTENFFVGHLSSRHEVDALARLQVAYAGVKEDILRSRQPGYMRMLTRSHRFVIPVQAHRFQV
jgi:hypothetical protein